MVGASPLTPKVFKALFDPLRAAASMGRAAVSSEVPDIYHAPLNLNMSHLLADTTLVTPAVLRDWCVSNSAKGSTAFRLIDADCVRLHACGVSSWRSAARYAFLLEFLLKDCFVRMLERVWLPRKVEEDGVNAAEVRLTALTMAMLRRTGTPCALNETGVCVLDGAANRPDCADPHGSAVRRSWPLRLATSLARQSELPTAIHTMCRASEATCGGSVGVENDTSSGTMHATVRVIPLALFGTEVTDVVLHELHHWRGRRDLARDVQAIAVRTNERRTLRVEVMHASWDPPEDLARDPESARIFARYRFHSLDEIPAYFLEARCLFRSTSRPYRAWKVRKGIHAIQLAQALLERDLAVLHGAVAALRAGEMVVGDVTHIPPASPPARPDRSLQSPSGDLLLFHSAQLNRGRSTEDPHDWSYDPMRVGTVLEAVAATLHAIQPRMAHTRTALEALLV